MKVIGYPVGPLQANAYLAICETTQKCAVVDPGGEAERLLAAAAQEGAVVESILLTHAHLDHVGGVAEAKRRTGAPVFLHPADLPLYRAAPEQARSFGLQIEEPPEPDGPLEEGQELKIGETRLEVRHTPGHSPGHVCLVGNGFALVGDCMFAGSIGRTDLPGGDLATLMDSIREKLLTLTDETVLYSGHGPETTVGRERASNPFLKGAFGWSG
ncbi:MAG: MBL fold metallo-hydrolase [Gemmatimonadetes bacterium]|uniref:MBL fold metallo-hydrolase n=1 Tax=Candidatus Kutchimonas denitrificans TaxID=3056748 RepID=A0AAE5CCL9_9BACT|nr:MBL fold metallo-hydrolase [Gemmatimonadota bacterium]NIR74369.1 MBL fold metallo-hydrolase [Candidatus Kutchimonas denitrificans]NIS02620.1 MBL fold metallo-hydrolase [Gemmatimonadota bacterium]NIT68495.1 MBL fold metallo-hydrolase [Gemmatimonadota bacterium]NIU51972.1 MBL fold metallo-hydrolase [Gemmatimonadota bacterium]